MLTESPGKFFLKFHGQPPQKFRCNRWSVNHILHGDVFYTIGRTVNLVTAYASVLYYSFWQVVPMDGEPPAESLHENRVQEGWLGRLIFGLVFLHYAVNAVQFFFCRDRNKRPAKDAASFFFEAIMRRPDP